jgi:hypothetical protein
MQPTQSDSILLRSILILSPHLRLSLPSGLHLRTTDWEKLGLPDPNRLGCPFFLTLRRNAAIFKVIRFLIFF